VCAFFEETHAMPTPFRRPSLLVTTALVLAGLAAPGCATNKQTGALAGGGLGAAIGGAAGGTKYAVIGSAAGAGVGYLIGNKKDKEEAENIEQQNAANKRAAELHSQVGNLGGTRWNVVKLTPEPETPYVLKVIQFDNDGHVTSTTTAPDGDETTWRENYRVVGNTLIVNRKGVLVNVRFTISAGPCSSTRTSSRRRSRSSDRYSACAGSSNWRITSSVSSMRAMIASAPISISSAEPHTSSSSSVKRMHGCSVTLCLRAHGRCSSRFISTGTKSSMRESRRSSVMAPRTSLTQMPHQVAV
jgi:uncharacterized protein YcfJ